MQAQPEVFSTKPLLRPAQVERTKEEISTLKKQLESPHIEDKGAVATRLRRVMASFDAQAPRPPESVDEEGRMVARRDQLQAEFRQGMLSHAEMRQAPDGAVTAHMEWEKNNKKKIQEWRNLQYRLNPGDTECGKIERFRPKTSTLNLDSAVIPGRQFYFGPPNAGLPVTFSDEQIALLRAVDPAFADRLGSLTNVQRSEVKDVLKDGGIGLVREKDPEAVAEGYRGVAIREANKASAKAPI